MLIPTTGGTVGSFVIGVDRQVGPVVLEHSSNHGRIMDRRLPLREILVAHAVEIAVVPGVGVGIDDGFGHPGSGEEEPMPSRRGEPGVGSVEVLADGQAVQQRGPGDRSGMAQGQAPGVVAAAVVAHDGELLGSQLGHAVHHVGGRRPLGVRAWSAVGPGVPERS